TGGRHTDSRARYVRAFLSHGFRRQGRELRGYVHGRHSLEQCGAHVRSSDEWLRSRGRHRARGHPRGEICGEYFRSWFLLSPWRQPASPMPRRSTGRKSTRRWEELPPCPATFIATAFHAPTCK